MSSESTVPTYILQSDGLFREGLRLILSKTRFRPHGCAIDLEDLLDIPNDRPVLFIVGVGENEVAICGKIKSQYPLAFIVAVADDSNPRLLAGALEDGANAALFNSVSPDALVSTLQAVVNGKLDSHRRATVAARNSAKGGRATVPPACKRDSLAGDRRARGNEVVRSRDCHS